MHDGRLAVRKRESEDGMPTALGLEGLAGRRYGQAGKSFRSESHRRASDASQAPPTRFALPVASGKRERHSFVQWRSLHNDGRAILAVSSVRWSFGTWYSTTSMKQVNAAFRAILLCDLIEATHSAGERSPSTKRAMASRAD